MASGLTSSARRFVVQLEITNKTKPSEQLASLGPQSSRLFFKNKLTRDGVLAPSATVFRPFTWRFVPKCVDQHQPLRTNWARQRATSISFRRGYASMAAMLRAIGGYRSDDL